MHIEKRYDTRKLGVCFLSLISIIALAGCAGAADSTTEVFNIQNKHISAVEMGTASTIKSPVIDLLEEGEEPIEMKSAIIYFGNGSADGLDSELAESTELSPAWLIRCLSEKNIVSIDTKVQNFEELEVEGNKQLNLDLNKSFGRYLQTMGTAGEQIIMAALVNTFLEAYEADCILITVDGKTLKSGHNHYEAPIVYMELNTEG